MAQKPKNELSYSERNKNNVERLLEKDAGSVRAVMANTVETKILAGKLRTIDMIFNNARQRVGYGVKFEDFQKLSEKFQAIEKSVDDMIDEAILLEIYTPRDSKVSDFAKNKDKMAALIKAGKTDEEIAKELSLDEQKVKAWSGSIKAELSKDSKEEATAQTKIKKAA